MNKLFSKIATAIAGFAMVVGAGVGIDLNAKKQAKMVFADNTYTETFNYSALQNNISGDFADANSYYKIPSTSNNSATITLSFGQSYTPTSDIVVTLNIATFGSGTNPSDSNSTISAIGSDNNSTWSGSNVSSYPSSSTYVDGVLTVSSNPKSEISGLIITMGVDSGVKIFRLKYISVSFDHSGGSQTYTVTYDANGGVGTLTDSNSPYDPGSTVTVLSNTFTKENYTFSHWNTASNDSGASYSAGDTFTINANTTLYAQWLEPIPSAGSITITGDDFTGSYENGDTIQHLSTVANSTAKVPWKSVNVMKNSGAQFKASGGNIYNTVDLGNILSISISGATTLTVYYGTSEAPSSGTIPGTGNGYFKIIKNGNGAATATSITITWGAPVTLDSITAALDTAASSKTWYAGDELTASDIDVTTSYSDSSLNSTITNGTGVYFNSTFTQTTYTLSQGTNNITIYYKDSNNRSQHADLTVNNVQAAKTVQTWSITGEIGDTLKSTAYNLSGLTLHAWYDNEKTDEAPASIANLYELVANPSSAGPNPNQSNTISVEVYLKTDTGHSNCLESFSNVPAPIVNTPKGSAEDNPYTVSEARAAIDSGNGVAGVYARGIVSKIVTPYNSQYGNITYDISADGLTTSDQLRAYRGKNTDGANFTSADDVKVGAIVVVYGNLVLFNSTYEFEAENQLVSSINPHTVTFNSHEGSSVDSQVVTHGFTAARPSDPTKAAADNEHTCTFAGWYTDSEYNTEYSFSTPVTSDITLHAKWDIALIPAKNIIERDLKTTSTLAYHYSKTGNGSIDVLTRSLTGVTNGSSSYTSWSGKTDASGAVYSGKSAGGKDSIQLRTSGGDEGVVVTAPNTNHVHATKVTLHWHGDTADTRQVDVYGKATAYASASELFSAQTQGQLIGSSTFNNHGTNTTTYIEIDGEYEFEYIGIKSHDSALYLTSIEIQWGVPLTYSYSNISMRFGASISKTLYSRLDTESSIQGFGVMIASGEALNENEYIKDNLNARELADAQPAPSIDEGDIVDYYMSKAEMSVPPEVGDNYVWNLFQTIDEADIAKVFVAVAYIKINDGYVFLDQVRYSAKTLAAEYIATNRDGCTAQTAGGSLGAMSTWTPAQA